MRVRKGLSVLACAALMLVAGCDNAEYRQQIAAFQQSIGNTRSAVESYYLEMNQVERDICFLRLGLDKQKSLGIKFLTDSRRREVTEIEASVEVTRSEGRQPRPEDGEVTEGETTVEVTVGDGPFPRKAIQARLDAISLLGLYGRRLAELAGSKAPLAFADNSAALGENIVKLSGTFASLS